MGSRPEGGASGHSHVAYHVAYRAPRSLGIDSRDAHDLPGVLVDDGPTPQWLLKANLNAIQAIHAASERSGEGPYLDLYLDVRLS